MLRAKFQFKTSQRHVHMPVTHVLRIQKSPGAQQPGVRASSKQGFIKSEALGRIGFEILFPCHHQLKRAYGTMIGRHKVQFPLNIAIFYGRTEARKLYCQARSEEHTSELQSLMRISYAVFCVK